ncbi:hypothetical protein B0T16DRAFT_410369 [Cercophora newfieldiana]|uniref:Uncharacterized protein n=1 Tax=Cercophora newfieldiana TaxID=92897 RepID=A0AA40CS89_9PEZI|nr:hypothetical protein B0T16DRAFT_410369 [Cercophora newfieldiana]
MTFPLKDEQTRLHTYHRTNESDWYASRPVKSPIPIEPERIENALWKRMGIDDACVPGSDEYDNNSIGRQSTSKGTLSRRADTAHTLIMMRTSRMASRMRSIGMVAWRAISTRSIATCGWGRGRADGEPCFRPRASMLALAASIGTTRAAAVTFSAVGAWTPAFLAVLLVMPSNTGTALAPRALRGGRSMDEPLAKSQAWLRHDTTSLTALGVTPYRKHVLVHFPYLLFIFPARNGS